MSESLFDPGLVYPSDRYGGEFVELSGVITGVGDDLDQDLVLHEVMVSVKTDKGVFRGVARYPRSERPFHPEVGHHARIRVYNIGGGWYPDFRVIYWERGP